MSGYTCKVRHWREGETLPAVILNTGIEIMLDIAEDEEFECWQPDCIENDEYGRVIIRNGIFYKVINIDFDDSEEEPMKKFQCAYVRHVTHYATFEAKTEEEAKAMMEANYEDYHANTIDSYSTAEEKP